MTSFVTTAVTSSGLPPIHTPHVDYLSILPMLIMIGGALALMVASSLFRKILGVGSGTLVASTVSIAALVAALFQWDHVSTHGPQVTIAGAIAFDGFDVFVQISVAIGMLLTALVGDGYLRREGIEGPEFHVLAMMSASGAMMMGAANDLIVIFLGLEIMSIALYVLAAFNHKRAESGEAALKYFVLGAFSSAIFVYGIALVYGATGSTNLPQIADYLSGNVIASNGVLLGGLALLLVGFGFKIAAVPFHMWSPDVYQGSPSPVTGFMAAVVKTGAFAALLRVFVSSFGTVRTDWQPIIWALALLSLVLGAVVALMQRDVKRMMAYSSINHVGFILLGVEAATTRGVSSSLYYIFTYMFLVIGSFAVITVMARDGDNGHQISDYRGLAKRQPRAGPGLRRAAARTGRHPVHHRVPGQVRCRGRRRGHPCLRPGRGGHGFGGRRRVLLPAGGGGHVLAGRDDRGHGGRRRRFRVPTVRRPTLPPLRISSPRAGSPDSVASSGTPDEVSSLQILTDAPPAQSVTERGAVPVPTLTWLVIGISVAFSVVFGIIPEPILNFAHQATLLFT